MIAGCGRLINTASHSESQVGTSRLERPRTTRPRPPGSLLPVMYRNAVGGDAIGHLPRPAVHNVEPPFTNGPAIVHPPVEHRRREDCQPEKNGSQEVCPSIHFAPPT